MKNRSPIQSELNTLLSNEFALFQRTLNYHWNLSGPRFHSLHVFFGEQYNTLLEYIDMIAERNRIIEGTPIGTLEEVRKRMTLKEVPSEIPSTSQMIASLSEGHLEIISEVQTTLKKLSDDIDPGTEDMLVEILRGHEKMQWMLRSHIE